MDQELLGFVVARRAWFLGWGWRYSADVAFGEVVVSIVGIRAVSGRSFVFAVDWTIAQFFPQVSEVVLVLILQFLQSFLLPLQGFEVSSPVYSIEWFLIIVIRAFSLVSRPMRVNVGIWRVSIISFRLVLIIFWSCDFACHLYWFLPIIPVRVISFSSFYGSFLALWRILSHSINFSVVVMMLQFLIHIRSFGIPRKSLNELMLYLIQAILILFLSLLMIRINTRHSHLQNFIQNPFQVQLIRQLNVQIDPSLCVSLVDVPQAIDPGFIIIPCVSFVVGVDDLAELAIYELSVHPFHLLWAQQDALAVVFASFKLANVFVAVAEEPFTKGLKVGVAIVSPLNRLYVQTFHT